MNVTSLEQSKSLFDLSQWRGTDQRWLEDTVEQGNLGTFVSDQFAGGNFKLVAPAYDLGYLLRRLDAELPEEIELTSTRHYDGSRNWCATYRNYFSYQDSPEDAVAQVAVDLFKKAVITKAVV